MIKVDRRDILDYVTYEENRAQIRASAMQAKAARRIHVGPHLTFLFEDTETIRYQIHEMVRAERMVKETSIQHEIDTYNALLGDHHQLGCTLLIEFTDSAQRDRSLRQLLDLPEHLFLLLEDDMKSYAQFDETQQNEEKLSSVQFLKFICPAKVIALGCDHPLLPCKANFSDEQRKTLNSDLGW